MHVNWNAEKPLESTKNRILSLERLPFRHVRYISLKQLESDKHTTARCCAFPAAISREIHRHARQRTLANQRCQYTKAAEQPQAHGFEDSDTATDWLPHGLNLEREAGITTKNTKHTKGRQF
jgi:hypothetical protein